MRLGVVGMLPQDFRTITAEHLAGIRTLKLSGAAFHAGAKLLFEVQPAECQAVKRRFAEAGLDLVQFGLGYRDCLFDPRAEVRDELVRLIGRGIEVARELEAQVCLIRTGSLNPHGPYSPSRQNLEPASRERLIETLRRIAAKAEAVGQTMVIETHLLTIMDSPETNHQVIEAVGSDRMRVVMDYVNHFQTLGQVYHSTERLNHIFEVMGPISPVGHCKDIRLGDGLVLHIDEAIPGEGELDLATALHRWHDLYPDGYMLLEHLPTEHYPPASRNVHRIVAEAGIEIH
jgi:sugar phosphate isomerase/epimerase